MGSIRVHMGPARLPMGWKEVAGLSKPARPSATKCAAPAPRALARPLPLDDFRCDGVLRLNRDRWIPPGSPALTGGRRPRRTTWALADCEPTRNAVQLHLVDDNARLLLLNRLPGHLDNPKPFDLERHNRDTFRARPKVSRSGLA